MFKKLTEIRNNILIGKRLKALVLVIFFLITVLGLVSVASIFSINNKISEINDVYLKNMVKLSGLIENIYSILIESHIIDEKSLSDNAIDNALNIDLLDTYLAEYEYSLTDEAQRAQYDNFVLEFKNYVSILKEVNSYELNGDYDLAKEVKSGRELDSFKKLQSIIKSMMNQNSEGVRTGNQLIISLKNKILNRIYIISGLLLFLSILIPIFLLKDIGVSLKRLTSNLSVLRRGEVPEKELDESQNEIGQMAGLVNSLTGNLASLNKFANDISKGNYATDYKPASENDLLGKALLNLRNNLRVTKEDDERRKLEDERRNWTNKGHALFGEILRQRSHGIIQLTDDIIKNLVYYLKANQGGLFLINDTGDISKIDLVSAFAYDRKKFFERNINIGDGLIGTVALERNTIYLKEIPKDYIEIESGLGDATPKSLLIVPLKFEDEILGIVELASFKEFERYEIKFVEEVAQSIASTLLTAKINARTEQLLNDSQKQSEELAAREIEVRQNMEEMRATQELAQRREAALSGIISAVDNTLMKGEYELDGTLISVNNRHLQTMGYQLKEIKGKNIEMFIPKEELENFRKVWTSVISGTPRQLEVKRRTKTGEELWLINQYTPVTDISGKISRVLYLAHDVTKYKKSEEKSEVQSSALEFKEEELNEKLGQLDKAKEEITLKDNELSSILKAIGSEQVIIEFDLQGKILKANKRFEELSGITFNKLKGQGLDKFFKLNKTKEEFDTLFAKVISGDTATAINQYTTSKNKIFWLKEYYISILDAKKLPFKIISIAIDISQLKEEETKNSSLQKELENLASEETKTIKIKPGDIENKVLADGAEKLFPKVELDKELNFEKINDLFSKNFKFTLKDLKGKPLTRIITSKETEKLYSILDGLKPGQFEQFDVEIADKEKKTAWYNLKLIPVGKVEIEKVIIYFIKKSSDVGTIVKDDKKSKEELKAKSKELKEIENRINQLKKQSSKIADEYLDSDVDKLYNQWLNNIKKED